MKKTMLVLIVCAVYTQVIAQKTKNSYSKTPVEQEKMPAIAAPPPPPPPAHPEPPVPPLPPVNLTVPEPPAPPVPPAPPAMPVKKEI